MTVLRAAGRADVPVLLWGTPGTGKSALIATLGRLDGAHTATVIGSRREPADLAGLPVVQEDGSVVLAPPRWARELVEAGGGYLFLDELSRAAPAVQAAMLRVAMEKVVGDLPLPAATRIVAAANPADVAAGGWELEPPTANRFLHLTHVPGLDTFAVDAAWRLYLDPDTLHAWDVEEVAGVLLHEVGHLLRDHHRRHTERPVHHPFAWNLAADAEINDDLVAAGVPLPGDPVTPASLGRPEGLLAEEYFHRLLRDAGVVHPLPAAGPAGAAVATDPRCGSGSGGSRLPDELPVHATEHPGRSTVEAELTRRAVASAVRAAGAGTGTGAGRRPHDGWRRWAEHVLQPPRIAWQHQLRRTVRRGLAVEGGQLDLSYRRVGRRRIPRVVTPGMVQPRLRVGVVIDTSASMSRRQLEAALSELDGICAHAGVRPDDRLVVTADVEVYPAPRLRSASQLPLRGGGGTDLRPAITALATHRRRPSVVVVCTDGLTPWPLDAPSGCTVIVVLLPPADGHRPPRPPSWAEVVHLDLHDAGLVQEGVAGWRLPGRQAVLSSAAGVDGIGPTAAIVARSRPEGDRRLRCQRRRQSGGRSRTCLPGEADRRQVASDHTDQSGPTRS